MDSLSYSGTPNFFQSDLYDEKSSLSNSISTALHEFDGIKLSALLRNEVKDDHFSTPLLHELANNYCAYASRNRTAKLVAKCVDIVSLLIENGININETDGKQQNVLHLVAACPGNNSEFLNRLIDMGARVNQPDGGQQTPLHRAVVSGSLENAKCLLMRKADPNFIDFAGISPLHLAAKRRGGAELIHLLAACGGCINLDRPIWERDRGHGSQAATHRCSTPFHVAARYSRKENLRVLVELGADCAIEDICGRTALHIAAAHDLTGECCAILLRAYPGSRNLRDLLRIETPLHLALTAGNVDAAFVLLRGGADPDIQDLRGENSLHKAVQHIKSQALWLMMLEKGGRPDQVNLNGMSARIRATKFGNTVALAAMQLLDSKSSSEA